MELTLSVQIDGIYVYSGCILQQIAPANLNGKVLELIIDSG